MRRILSKTVTAVLSLTLLMQATAFAQKKNVYNIYNAYSTLNSMTLEEFSNSVIKYFGLKAVIPEANRFTEENVDEDILRLVTLKCINGYEDGSVRPLEIVGENRASVILGRFTKYIEDEDLANAEFVFSPSDVEPKMQCAEFWSSRIPNANEVLLSGDEINTINEGISATKETYMYHLDNFPDSIDGNSIKEELSGFTSPSGYYYNGEPTDEAFWQKIRDNIKGSSDGENTPIKYGIVTTHTALKQYPFEGMISDAADDVEWDQFSITGVNINEPVLTYITTKDNEFTYVKGRVAEGWIRTDSIAVCKDKEEWKKARNPEKFLIVTQDRLMLEPSSAIPELSYKTVNIGTKLEIAEDYDGSDMIMNRIPYSNYIVNFPMRAENGEYYTEKVAIPKNRGVNVGYVAFTRANIIKLAFNCLGDHYGWGGMLDSLDCSEFALRVYECTGILLPGNTSWQAAVPYGVISFDGVSTEEKMQILDNTNPGAIIQFKGHEMIYLGKENGKYYTINSVSSTAENGKRKRIRSVVVNSLDTTRASGHTWFEDLNKVIDITNIE